MRQIKRDNSLAADAHFIYPLNVELNTINIYKGIWNLKNYLTLDIFYVEGVPKKRVISV